MTEQVILLNDLKKALRRLNKIDWQAAGFHMGNWAKYRLPQSPELNCGTTCCAYGVGTTLPSWKHVGLQLRKTKGPSWASDVSFYPPANSRNKLHLSQKQWNYIFGPLEYSMFSVTISPGDVIKHINDVLKGKI